MVLKELQGELGRLHVQFKGMEANSELVRVVPEGCLLAVRLDGIKTSRKLLKNSLHHPSYAQAVKNACYEAFRIWRNLCPKGAGPFLVGFYALSDEVTAFVNTGPNYYDRRVMKIVTALAGTFSASVSLSYQPDAKGGARKQSSRRLMAFDARPLVLQSEHLCRDYMRWRWLLGLRNSMAKVLRLHSDLSDGELYDVERSEDGGRLADSLPAMKLELERFGVDKKVDEALRSTLLAAVPDAGLEAIEAPRRPAELERFDGVSRRLFCCRDTGVARRIHR